MSRLTIFVLGEQQRGDDGVADAIADALRLDRLPGVEIRQLAQLMPDDLLECNGAIIVLDAVVGPTPGTLVDVPLGDLVAMRFGWRSASSHAIPLEMTVAIATRLGGTPPRGRFIGVSGEAFGLGDEISEAVRKAVPVACARVQAWTGAMADSPVAARCA